MISPADIESYASKWWKEVLQSHITGVDFFPKSIDRIGKVQSSKLLDNFETIQNQVSDLYTHSKLQVGHGYVVKAAHKNFRRTGTHELPDSVVFETLEDYLQYTHKTKEWERFVKHYQLVIDAIPTLKEWVLINPVYLTISKTAWIDIVKVCRYFLENTRPQLYIRQLPVDVHTKFIEENEALLKSLLDFLIPHHVRDPRQKSFAERYYLKYDEPPQIRIRMLDPSLAIANLSDVQIRLSDFRSIPINCKYIFLAENKMNFLTLPEIPQTIAIWSGGGFNISYLKDIKWLSDKNIFYWGDLDIQGFHILHQMRSYYPQTKSAMMDMKTFERFKSEAGQGRPGNMMTLDCLNSQEMELFLYLKENNLRLEQEKITQSFADAILKSAVCKSDT